MNQLLIVLFQLCISTNQYVKIEKMTTINRINECRRLIYKCSDENGSPFSYEMIKALESICVGI